MPEWPALVRFPSEQAYHLTELPWAGSMLGDPVETFCGRTDTPVFAEWAEGADGSRFELLCSACTVAWANENPEAA